MVIRPSIQVKAIESDALGADWDGAEARPYLAVEAVLVHREIRWRVAEANKARRAGHGSNHIHQRPSRTLWFRSFRVKLPREADYLTGPQESRGGYRGKFSVTQTERLKALTDCERSRWMS
jgi:hypothetical protein